MNNLEELKREAEEKYFNHKMADFQGFYNHHYYYLGYIESAEPREKRITELERENEKLKKEIEISQRCWQEQKNISLDTNCKLHKAKELLKWALHSDPEHDEDFDQKWEEAEQFLGIKT